MGKRTAQTGLPDWDDAPDLSKMVSDKRKGKRANPAKGRRRNRRYENRMLSLQKSDMTELDVPIEGSSTSEHPSSDHPSRDGDIDPT